MISPVVINPDLLGSFQASKNKPVDSSIIESITRLMRGRLRDAHGAGPARRLWSPFGRWRERPAAGNSDMRVGKRDWNRGRPQFDFMGIWLRIEGCGRL
jgi:hypothetical protein